MSAARGASGVGNWWVYAVSERSRSGYVPVLALRRLNRGPAEQNKRGVAVARVDIIMPQMGESIAEGTLRSG